MISRGSSNLLAGGWDAHLAAAASEEPEHVKGLPDEVRVRVGFRVRVKGWGLGVKLDVIK